MTSLKHKVRELNETIRHRAQELGLVFVLGDGSTDAELALSNGSIEAQNHRLQESYLFAVAEE